MNIGERIAVYARERGIKQATIAEVCGAAPPTVSAWLKGNVESIPSACIIPLSKLLGCSPVELLTGDKYLVDDGHDDMQRLLDMYAALGWEGQQVVMATAIQEKRRAEEAVSRARARV